MWAMILGPGMIERKSCASGLSHQFGHPKKITTRGFASRLSGGELCLHFPWREKSRTQPAL
jgi:hypothetical protein